MARPRKAGFFVEAEFLSHWRRDVAGAAGVGVWSLAGAWCDDNLTDGHIPVAAVKRLVAGAGAAVARVTKSGLWTVCEEHDDCFLLHRYTEDGRGRKRQPSRREVLDRQAAERARKRSIPAGKVPVIRKESARNSELDTGLSSVIPPLYPPQGGEPAQAPASRRTSSRATTLREDFEVTEAMRAWAAEHVPALDLERATLEWSTYWRGRGATMKDWTQTWRNGMLKVDGRGDFRRRQPAGPAERPSRKIT